MEGENCEKRFTEISISPFKRMKFPDKIILYALKLIFRFRMTLRKAQELPKDINGFFSKWGGSIEVYRGY